jgi:hypothetical protein
VRGGGNVVVVVVATVVVVLVVVAVVVVGGAVDVVESGAPHTSGAPLGSVTVTLEPASTKHRSAGTAAKRTKTLPVDALVART